MKYVIANLKMNLLQEDMVSYASYLSSKQWNNITFVVCPSFPFLSYFSPVGAQNCSSFEKGAYTGEVSARQLESLGVSYCLVGHSERREYFHEGNETLHKKIKQLQEHHIIPIFCIGETLSEKESGKTKEVLKRQLQEVFYDIDFKKLILAYEPLYAIGTGKTPSQEEIESILNWLHEELWQAYGKEIPVLYGGSVDQENMESILKLPHVDGVLVGSFSTKYSLFIDTVCNIGGNL